MIPASRFIVQSRDRDEWLEARSRGVTATAVAEAATPSGFASLVASWSEPPFEGNGYTDFGTWAEPYLMRYAHLEHGILPNDWLIAGDMEWHLGTPDGLSPDHVFIGEAKTGGTIPASVPRKHRDQCLWNLHITGAEACLYLFQPRAVADDGSFYLGLLEPITFWVYRDEKRISELVGVAYRVLEAKEAHRGELQLG
jgi:hypothetical protein